jgi:LPS-assembly lipoprotein
MSRLTRATRRGVLLGLAGTLAGCGFHPLYATDGSDDAILQSIYVEIIANRNGQLLRQALQQRLEGTDSTAEKRFTLTVYLAQTTGALGIQTNSTVTRMRDVGKATWVLNHSDPPGAKVTNGAVRALDGYDVLNEQFFYQDLEEEQTQRRLADALADQIVQALATYFRTHPKIG